MYRMKNATTSHPAQELLTPDTLMPYIMMRGLLKLLLLMLDQSLLPLIPDGALSKYVVQLPKNNILLYIVNSTIVVQEWCI